MTDKYSIAIQLLTAVRKEAGLKQTEVGLLLGCPQSYVSKTESGERRVDIIELIAYCEVYGINPAHFFSRLEKLLLKRQVLFNTWQ